MPRGQGKARQGQARQGKARQGKARQGKARQGKARQGKARQCKGSESSHDGWLTRWVGDWILLDNMQQYPANYSKVKPTMDGLVTEWVAGYSWIKCSDIQR